MSQKPKISVLVITYKQESIISNTLNSLISQKDYLYEICISDDCSPDDTWKVLLNYQKQYPNLIKLHRNAQNLGIFENIEYTWTMPTGDIIYQLAGDDLVPEGWFKSVLSFITDYNIDYKNELFCIYGNYKVLYPNGDYIIRSNSAIARYPNDALRLAMRGLICGRSSCVSINVLKKFDQVSKGKSHIAEFLQDRMLQLHTLKNYYIPKVGNVYMARIGVSVHINEETHKERQKILPYAINYIENLGINIKQSDKYFADYQRAFSDFRYYRKVRSLMVAILYLILSFDIKLSFTGERIKPYIFAIWRRMYHKVPIQFK